MCKPCSDTFRNINLRCGNCYTCIPVLHHRKLLRRASEKPAHLKPGLANKTNHKLYGTRFACVEGGLWSEAAAGPTASLGAR